MSLLVASTVAPYKGQNPGESTSWLEHAEAWKLAGHEFFCAVEMVFDEDADCTWPAPLRPMLALLELVDAEVWSFKLDTNERTLTTGGRLVRICTGRNLAHEVLNRNPGRWKGILFLDTDVRPPPDAPERLLEVDRQLVGFNVGTYCMDGPRVTAPTCDHGEDVWDLRVGGHFIETRETQPFPDGADVREHWNTAGALMVREEAARRLRWRYDYAAGSTDDPCFQADAVSLGFGQTWVRHDVQGEHVPPTIVSLEARGHDLRI